MDRPSKRLPPLLLAAALLAAPQGAAAAKFFEATVDWDGNPAENVPVLLRLSGAAIQGFDHADVTSSGFEILDGDGQRLPWEIDTWNPDGESLVWVLLPDYRGGASFTVRYGGAFPDAPLPATNVWADYKGVWHMNAASPADASGNGNDGTAVGNAATDAGRIGAALSLADQTDYVTCGTALSNAVLAAGFTVEGWVNLANRTGYHAFFGKDLFITIRTSESNQIQITTPGKKDHKFNVAVPAAGTWWHFALTFRKDTSGGCKFFLNGTSAATATAGGITNQTDATEMWLGRNQWGDAQNFQGLLDEMRISAGIRSADWIAAEYHAMADAGALVCGAVAIEDPTAPVLATPAVARNPDGSFAVSVVVFENAPASIVCAVGGTDVAMTTSDASLPATYTADVSGLASGTYLATVRAEATSGTIVSATCPTAFHVGALTVTAVSDADEGSLTPGVFRVSRADADATGLPELPFDVAFSGDGLAAVAPGGATATIPAGAAYVDVSVTPVLSEEVDGDVELTMTVSGANVGASSSATLTVVNATYDTSVRYVAATGDDANHGGTPDRPKKTISAAVASLANVAQSRACTVHVAPGTYTLLRETDDPISLAAPIRVLGEGGTPEDVVVRRDERAYANSSAYRSYQDCSIFHLNHPGALVANLAMDYGSANQPSHRTTAGNAWIGANGGTISNCVVRNGSASHPYALSAGILVDGPGLVTHCIITNNVAAGGMEASWSASTLGSAVVLRGAGGRLENCLVRDNRSTTGDGDDRTSPICAEGSATVANCTIVGNQGRVCGGVYANGAGVTVRNCVIAGNADVGAAADNPNWMGTGAFVACATDDGTPVNGSCLAGTLPGFLPHLADDVPFEAGLRPAPGSPLLDAGADYEPMAAFDLSGRQSRHVGAAVDIGCYEDFYLSVEAKGEPAVGLGSFATDLALWSEFPADLSIVWSADGSFSAASTNLVETGATNGAYEAAIGGLETDTAYWWKLVADNGRTAVETVPASFRTLGAPVIGGTSESVDGATVKFSVDLASLARDALGNGLRTDVAVFCTTNGTDWIERPLGSATRARTVFGTATLSNGLWTWYARASAESGGRTFAAESGTRTFRVFHNETPPAGFRRIDATISYEGEAAEDIPVLLRLSEAIEGFRYADVANDGRDFLFSDADGNRLPFEIESWNPDGESLVWVRAPVFTNGAVIHLDYGASEADGTADAADVWRRYAGVWHLDETNAASAFGSYPNSTAAAGIDGEKAKASLAGEEGRFARSVRICGATKQGTGYKLGGVFVPDSGEGSPLDLGSTFAISGWFKHKNQDFYYDKLFAKRKNGDNGDSPNGAFAVEVGSNNSTHKLSILGNSGSAGTANLPSSVRNAWGYLSFVYDGTSCHVYENGAFVQSVAVAPATDNDAPLCFGNMTDGYGEGEGHSAWCGWIDEVRLADGVPSAAWLAAEYAAMADADAVRFGAARALEMPVLEEPPSLAWDRNGFVCSASVAYGLGDVLLATVDLYDGSATTNAAFSFDSPDSLPQALSENVGLGENRMYRAVAVLRSSDGSEEDFALARETVYSGQLTASWVSDADIETMAPAVVRLSRANTPEAVCAPLVVAFELSGDAVGLGLFESVATATIPAGESFVDVEIRPVARSVVPGDYDAMLTVSGNNVANPSGTSAPFGVRNAGADPYVRFVAPNGDDGNDGLLATRPKRTIAAAIASFSGNALASLCTVRVAPGTYVLARATDDPIAVTNAIRILGGGATPEDVVVRRDERANANSSAYRSYQDCSIFRLNHPDALVANLAMEHGSAKQPTHGAAGNAWIGANGGTISNCVVRGGYAYHPWTVSSGILVAGPGLVTHCVITNNVCDAGMEASWSASTLASAVAMQGAGSRLENCLIRDNRSADDAAVDKTSAVCARSTATVANCTIVGNSGRVCGGVFADGSGVTVRNCAIAGNADVGVDADHPNWRGSGSFVACATDDAAPVNERCFAGPLAAFFRNPAAGDWRPKSGGPLVDGGVNYEPMAGVDLTGVQPRRIGSRVDVGCHEAFAETTVLILR